MMDKTLIQHRFKKNLGTYQDHCVVQRQMADRLIQMLQEGGGVPRRILEIGCGTGVLTEKLIKLFPQAEYVAVDVVGECEEYIQRISPQIQFLQGDIETMQLSGEFDLIISNAVFQWVEDLPLLVGRLKRLLPVEGKFIFSSFGNENFKEIRELTGLGLDYSNWSGLGFQSVDDEVVRLRFDSPVEVLRHLKYTGVNCVTSQHWTKSDLMRFEENYPKDEGYFLTYHPVYVFV